MSEEKERKNILQVLLDLYKDRARKKLERRTRTLKETSDKLMKSDAAGLVINEYRKTRRVKEIGEGAYVLTEAVFSNQFLFVGEEKALLIDTGLGVKGLKDEVDRLIDGKPLTVVATHASPWCVGGAGEFKQVFIGKKDVKAAKDANRYFLRKWLFRADPFRYFLNLSDDDLLQKAGKFKALDPEDEFDLGGRTVKMEETPAQTPGGISFHDDKSNVTVSGDVVSPICFMAGPRAVPLETYKTSIQMVEHLTEDGTNYCTHIFEPLQNSLTADLRILVNGLTDDINDSTKALAVKTTGGFRRILIYAPYRIQRRSIKTKLDRIWND